jgi:hypothetical protein
MAHEWLPYRPLVKIVIHQFILRERIVMRSLLILIMLVSAVTPLFGQSTSNSCPKELPEGTVCYRGRDQNGADYLIAVPKNYNHNLVLFIHGGGTPAATPIRTWGRWGGVVENGYAMAGSSFRKDFTMTQALEDTKNLKQIFVRIVGTPNRTLGLGISAGGPIAAKAAEHPDNADGSSVFDGILVACSFDCGNQEKANIYLDMRVVYQYYCKNLPRAGEPQYPLWRGLPLKTGEQFSNQTMEDYLHRVNECTGIQLPPEKRTARQRGNLENILNVTKVSRALFLVHFPVFLSVTAQQYGGNVSSNTGVHYRGSSDDVALNRDVARYAADSQVAAKFDLDVEPTGDLKIPVLTLHAIGDTVPVEVEAIYAGKVSKAGRTQDLAQVYFYAMKHCDFTSAELNAAADGLLNWIASGTKPTSKDVLDRCMSKLSGSSGAYRARDCSVALDYQPRSQLGAR